MSVVFFAVAAGSILYVVQELFAVNRSYGHPKLVTWLVLAGHRARLRDRLRRHRRRRLTRPAAPAAVRDVPSPAGDGPRPHP